MEKWGPGCHFFGHGLDKDLDDLESLLAREHELHPGTPPVLALFTEFPSNPLLRSADLPRLRALADKYGFLLIVDDTLGNFANVEVLPYADVVVSSLSKVFSGSANVMGGRYGPSPEPRITVGADSYMQSRSQSRAQALRSPSVATSNVIRR